MGAAPEGDLAQSFGILDGGTEHAPRAAREAPQRKRPRAIGAGRSSRRVTMPASREITLEELLAHGVPRTTFQNRPASGVLEPTGRRGVYRSGSP